MFRSGPISLLAILIMVPVAYAETAAVAKPTTDAATTAKEVTAGDGIPESSSALPVNTTLPNPDDAATFTNDTSISTTPPHKPNKKKYDIRKPATMTAQQTQQQLTAVRMSCANHAGNAAESAAEPPCPRGKSAFIVTYQGNKVQEVTKLATCSGKKSEYCK
jgi:hypothetical protein